MFSSCAEIAIVDRTYEPRKTITIAYANNISVKKSQDMARSAASDFCPYGWNILNESAGYQQSGYMVNQNYVTPVGRNISYVTFGCK